MSINALMLRVFSISNYIFNFNEVSVKVFIEVIRYWKVFFN